MVLDYPLWKKLLVVIVLALGLVYAVPNFVPSLQNKNAKEFFALGSTMNLGLDLKGGAYLLLEIDSKQFMQEKTARLEDDVRNLLRQNNIGYLALSHNENGVRVALRATDVDVVSKLLNKKLNQPAVSPTGVAQTPLDIAKSGNGLLLSYTTQGQAQMLKQLQDQAANIVRRRVDALGNREAVVSPQGSDRLMVAVPGEKDSASLKTAIGKTAKLSFYLPAKSGEQSFTLYDAGGRGYSLGLLPVVGGDDLEDASASFSENQPVVSFRFSGAGARAFGQATTDNVGKPLFIVLDGKIISAPNIRQPITGGSGIITGNFTVAETQTLALLLKAGALPAPLKILEERSVGAGLGADSIRAGQIASLVGFLAVLSIMVIIYRIPGLFAGIALIGNLILLVAVMTAFHSTLTLPGIAGIVLTMGIAVDANVLIYERAKEELMKGKSVVASWQDGFNLAFATIWDSHLTNLLSTLLLFIFGAGPIKGFALSLTLGIVTSLFSAIMVTRMLVVWWIRKFNPKTVGF
ncbi:MAG: protein translocase subunit SecD [Hydrotalea sp.]|nr:protein translocase subunit SecD [Hydrotalea sp.]